jgi:hypothetical protein
MLNYRLWALHITVFSVVPFVSSTNALADITGTIWKIPGAADAVPLGVGGIGGVAAGGVNEGSFTSPVFSFYAGGSPSNPVVSGVDQDLQQFLSTDRNGNPTGAIYSGVNPTYLAMAMGGADLLSTGGPVAAFGSNAQEKANTLCYAAGNAPTLPGNSSIGCYSTEIEVTGIATFTAGQTYSVTHDDGIIMDVNGLTGPVMSAVGPNSSEVTSWTPTVAQLGGTSLTQNFTIWYVESSGNPAVLTSNIVTVGTPEPGTITALLVMLAGVAGLAAIMKKKRA